MSLINIDRLRTYAERGRNVLLEGHAGVGKSSAILESFGSLKYKYFSAPTLDPWIDLVGAPRDVFSEKHGAHVLTLVRPEWVLDADVEIIFFDELNRASPKVLDAVMELIQFKSINGFKFPKLRAVWAAINPADDNGDYKVEELDRALRDRFQVQLRIPYDVDDEYFSKKYPETGQVFCSWWRTLNPTVKNKVSPRRLDYLAEAYHDGDPLGDYLPDDAPVAALRKALKMQPFHEQMDAITNDEDAAAFLKKGNNTTKLLELVKIKDKQALAFFRMYQHVVPAEFVQVIAPVANVVEAGKEVVMTFEDLLKELLNKKKVAGTIAYTEMVNSTEFALFFKNGGSLQQTMKSCIRTKPTGWSNFASHLWQVYSAGEKAVMEKASKTTNGSYTNLMNCLLALVSADADDKLIWDQKQRAKMSNHMYLHKIVPAKWA